MVLTLITALMVGCAPQIPQSVNSTVKPSQEEVLSQPKKGNVEQELQSVETNKQPQLVNATVKPLQEKVVSKPKEEQNSSVFQQKVQEKKTSTTEKKEVSKPKEVKKGNLKLQKESQKPTSNGENKTAIPYGETIKKVALLVVAKNAPVVITEKNQIFEGTLNKKQSSKECVVITVKVKDKKTKQENDYLVTVCGKKIKIEPEKEKKSQ